MDIDSNSPLKNDIIKNKDIDSNEFENDCNSLNENEYSSDFYDDDNIDYVNTPAYPKIPCPTRNDSRYNQNLNSSNNIKFEYIKPEQKIIFLKNTSNYINTDHLSQNIGLGNNEKIITFKKCFVYDKIDEEKNNINKIISHSHNDGFSDKTKRFRILSLTTSILNTLETKKQNIKDLKSKINPFEKIFFQNIFQNKSSIQLANINALCEQELLLQNNIYDFTGVIISGDDGGWTNYFLDCSKTNFSKKIYNIQPIKNRILTNNKLVNNLKGGSQDNIVESKKDEIFIIDNKKIENFNIDDPYSFEDFFLSDLNDKSENELFTKENFPKLIKIMVEKFVIDDSNFENENIHPISLYLCRKKLPFSLNINEQENKLNFLCNTVLALYCLDNSGNYVIKIHETYSKFTIDLIFILFCLFEQISIIKPYSSNYMTSSRFLICRGYKYNESEEIRKKLKDFTEYYLDIRSRDLDQDYILENDLFNDESIKEVYDFFVKYMIEIIKDIDEKRIDRLNEALNQLNNCYKLSYSKFFLKQELFRLWNIKLSREEEEILKRDVANELLVQKGGGTGINKNEKIINSLPHIKHSVPLGDDYDKSDLDLLNIMPNSCGRKRNKDNFKKNDNKVFNSASNNSNTNTKVKLEEIQDILSKTKKKTKNTDETEKSKTSKKISNDVDNLKLLNSKINVKNEFLIKDEFKQTENSGMLPKPTVSLLNRNKGTICDMGNKDSIQTHKFETNLENVDNNHNNQDLNDPIIKVKKSQEFEPIRIYEKKEYSKDILEELLKYKKK